MITIKCVETGDVYRLSGDDETFNVTIYSDIAASLAGMVREGTYLKMHQKDLEYRIAMDMLTSFNHAFHAHERALMLKQEAKKNVFAASTLNHSNSSYYHENLRRRNEQRFQNPIIFTDET